MVVVELEDTKLVQLVIVSNNITIIILSVLRPRFPLPSLTSGKEGRFVFLSTFELLQSDSRTGEMILISLDNPPGATQQPYASLILAIGRLGAAVIA